jgi:hypothetical protein
MDTDEAAMLPTGIGALPPDPQRTYDMGSVGSALMMTSPALADSGS